MGTSRKQQPYGLRLKALVAEMLVGILVYLIIIAVIHEAVVLQRIHHIHIQCRRPARIHDIVRVHLFTLYNSAHTSHFLSLRLSCPCFFIIKASTTPKISRYSEVKTNLPAYVAMISRTVPLYSASGENTLISGAASSIITVSITPISRGTAAENIKKNRREKLPSLPLSSCTK